MRVLCILFLVFLNWLQLFSQDSIMVTRSFEFQDGIYQNLDQLKANQPGIYWKEVTSTYFTNPISLIAEVDQISDKSSQSPLSVDSIFAICKNGTPFINMNSKTEAGMAKFAGLKVRGYLSFYSFTEKEIEKIKIQAINPLNGQPFRTGFVEKEKEITIEKVFNWADGSTTDFNQKNMLELVADDAPLAKSIEELRDFEIKDKLFKCLLIYNDRHSIFVPRFDL